MVGIELDKICFIILKARQLNVKEQPVIEDPVGSNLSDDNFQEILSGDVEDASEEELRSVIDDFNVDERIRLVALTWIGRGDFDRDEWEDALTQVVERRIADTASYLLEMPLLADYLEEGLASFELSCVGEEQIGALPDGTPALRREDPGEGMAIRRTGGSAAGEDVQS